MSAAKSPPSSRRNGVHATVSSPLSCTARWYAGAPMTRAPAPPRAPLPPSTRPHRLRRGSRGTTRLVLETAHINQHAELAEVQRSPTPAAPLPRRPALPRPAAIQICPFHKADDKKARTQTTGTGYWASQEDCAKSMSYHQVSILISARPGYLKNSEGNASFNSSSLLCRDEPKRM